MPKFMNMPNTPTDRATAPTLPPGTADVAAANFERELLASGTERSAAFWAECRRARDSLSRNTLNGYPVGPWLDHT